MIKLSKKWPSWRRLQGLWLISSLLEQEIQIKHNRSWKKRRSFWILTLFTFCLIVSWVFVIETITGSQIKDFWLGVWNLGSNLRKLYPADCQTMGLSNYRNIEGTSKMSKKPRAVVPKTTSGIKISNFITFATTDSIGVLFKRSC